MDSYKLIYAYYTLYRRNFVDVPDVWAIKKKRSSAMDIVLNNTGNYLSIYLSYVYISISYIQYI